QEHHAIIHIMEYLQKKGFHVTYLPVNEKGQVDPNDIKRTLTDQTILVSVMYANNETGVIQPIEEIAAMLKDHQAYFHTDTVKEKGQVDPNDIKRTLTDQTILVSVMYANNETGVIQPIEEIAALLKDHQAYFHTDAVQAYSMLDINVKKSGIDLLTTSGHKLN